MVRVAESTPTFTFCPRQKVTQHRHHLVFARRIRDTLDRTESAILSPISSVPALSGTPATCDPFGLDQSLNAGMISALK
jgi:hypothetical protein